MHGDHARIPAARRKTDLAVAALFSLTLHATVLGAAGRWIGAPEPREIDEVSAPPVVAAPAVELRVIDPGTARAMLEPVALPVPRPPSDEAPRHRVSDLPSPWVPPEVPFPMRLDSTPIGVPMDASPLPPLRPTETLERPPSPPTPAPHVAPPTTTAPALPPHAATTEAGDVPSIDDPERAGGLILRRVPVDYPIAARRRGLEGVVTVGVEVGRDGEVFHAWVIRGSGHGLLDRAALRSIRHWRFDPRAVADAGLGWRFRQDVTFTLEGSSAR